MRLINSSQHCSPPNGSCVTIGNFDGVHLGHQSLIHRALDIGHANNLETVAITFWPHPRLILPAYGEHFPLSTREERLGLLEAAGVENILEIAFTPSLASMGARDFVRQYLLPLNLRHLVVGHDFTLGRGREGNADFLDKLAKEWGFVVNRVTPLFLDGEVISSTRLRGAIKKGEMELAARLLGRPYKLCGKVVHGQGRGTGLGFPTANLGQYEALLPAHGVYASLASYDGKRYLALTNIGANPTFGHNKTSVESFLLDCDQNIYGKRLCIEFLARIREERTFASPHELVGQISKDMEKARQIFRSSDLPADIVDKSS